MTNPLLTLGIEPSICKLLTNEQLAVLIRSHFRTLVSFLHSDKGGKEKKARELIDANEQLQDPTVLAYWATEARKKTKTASLKQEVTALQDKFKEERSAHAEQILRLVQDRLGTLEIDPKEHPHAWPLGKLGEGFILVSVPGPSAYRPLMMELSVTTERVVTSYAHCAQRFPKDLASSKEAEPWFAQRKDKGSSKSYFWEISEGIPFEGTIRIVGIIPADSYKSLAMSSTQPIGENPSREHTLFPVISTVYVKRFLINLEPVLYPNCGLLGMNQDGNFVALGEIRNWRNKLRRPSL